MPNEDMRTVVAVYPDLEHARKGVHALEAAGIDGANIHLEGGSADAAQRQGDTGDRDAGVVKGVASRAGRFGLIGALAGGLVGFLAGLPFFGPLGLIASAVGAAGAIGAFSAFVGGMSKLSMSEDWDVAHEGGGGEARLRLETASDEEAAAGMKVLRGTDPVRVVDLTKEEEPARRPGS